MIINGMLLEPRQAPSYECQPVLSVATELRYLQLRRPLMICTNQHNTCQACYQKLKSTRKCPFCKLPLSRQANQNRILAQQIQRCLAEAQPSGVKNLEGDRLRSGVALEHQQNEQDLQSKTIEAARALHFQQVTYYISVSSKKPLTEVLEINESSANSNGIFNLQIFKNLTTLSISSPISKGQFSCRKYPFGSQHYKFFKVCDQFLHNYEIGFGHLPKLKVLRITCKHLHSVPVLGLFPSLETLQLTYAGVGRMAHFSSFKNLKQLNLQHNCIQKMKGMEGLVSLRRLNLSVNSIGRIENIDSLINLEYLSLNGNHIEVIQNLNKAVKLKTLQLSNNQIAKIQNLQKLANLSCLDLLSNKIRIVENLYMLLKLRTLKLDKERIDRQASKGELRALREVQNISI